VATPEGQVRLFPGACHGAITFNPRGDMGFGYDPVFYLAQANVTMAELSPEEKNRVSHRGKAARKAIAALRKLADGKDISWGD
jgi:XTP/dITP diphosphohydrolase